MSSMLTWAWPSASATSATAPGRFSTPIRSSRSVAAGEVRLEQAAPVLAGGGMPAPDRVGVAGSDQLCGLAQPRPDRIELARRPPRCWWRRCRPRSPGWRRRRGSCRESSCPTSGRRSDSSETRAAASLTSALASTCGRWLTVAITRSWVSGSIACGRAPRSATVLLEAVVVDPARALGRRQVPARALEQVGAGVLDPGGLGAGERMSADEPASRRRRRRSPRSARAWSSRHR